MVFVASGDSTYRVLISICLGTLVHCEPQQDVLDIVVSLRKHSVLLENRHLHGVMLR